MWEAASTSALASGGMVSIGQQAYLGLGGYALLVMGNFWEVNPFVAVPIAALFTMLVALPVSQLAFRLQGGFFAIGTWVIAEVFRLSIANWSAVSAIRPAEPARAAVMCESTRGNSRVK